jgi:hypothetical protein
VLGTDKTAEEHGLNTRHDKNEETTREIRHERWNAQTDMNAERDRECIMGVIVVLSDFVVFRIRKMRDD